MKVKLQVFLALAVGEFWEVSFVLWLLYAHGKNPLHPLDKRMGRLRAKRQIPAPVKLQSSSNHQSKQNSSIYENKSLSLIHIDYINKHESFHVDIHYVITLWFIIWI
jgi:hypothetical protein